MKKIFTLCACALLSCMSIARAESVTVDIEDYDGVECKSYEADLTYSDGVYTITNFLNTGAPLSFKFDSTKDESPVELTGNIYDGGDGCYYLMTADKKRYPTGIVYDAKGSGSTNVYYPMIYNDGTTDYTYAMRVNKATYGYDYYASFYVMGTDDNDKDLDYYVSFFFNAPTETGLSLIEANDENAPVEYYNLNGQRVNNPANGIFVRKQGSKVEKVVIK